jgi:hypothetical protein
VLESVWEDSVWARRDGEFELPLETKLTVYSVKLDINQMNV